MRISFFSQKKSWARVEARTFQNHSRANPVGRRHEFLGWQANFNKEFPRESKLSWLIPLNSCTWHWEQRLCVQKRQGRHWRWNPMKFCGFSQFEAEQLPGDLASQRLARVCGFSTEFWSSAIAGSRAKLSKLMIVKSPEFVKLNFERNCLWQKKKT